MTDMRLAAAEAARTWIHTPYRHQASAKGVGADCLGVVRGVYRELYDFEPDFVPHYSPDWAERGDSETLLNAAFLHLLPIDLKTCQAGDVLVFRFSRDTLAKHCAIISAPDRMIHAWQGQSVCETAIRPFWRRRVAGAFCFPSKY